MVAILILLEFIFLCNYLNLSEFVRLRMIIYFKINTLDVTFYISKDNLNLDWRRYWSSLNACC